MNLKSGHIQFKNINKNHIHSFQANFYHQMQCNEYECPELLFDGGDFNLKEKNDRDKI